VRTDPKFSSHAAAELSPDIRSFIGVPVALSDGTFYGTLCAVDPEPRETLTRQQADLMEVLARLLATQIERQQAEEELRLRDRAIAASNNGIVITDPNLPDNPIIFANESFLRTTGYGADEVVGRNCRFLQGQDRDQSELDELRGAIREGRECRVVLRNYKKDGTPFWNELSISPVHDEAGRLINHVGVQNDITERKRAEEERERLLAQRWKARAEAEERKRISRELHDRVAHAMGVAHQSLELHDALKRTDPEAASAKMSLAKRSTVEAMNLTRDLARELRGAEVRGSLSAALSGLIEAAVPPGVERAVCVEGDEALVPPHAREQLFVILREGVRNAVSHSEAGRIYVGVNVSPAEVVGRVEDDGRGFAGEEGANRGGVRSMRERAELVGGTFRSASGSGIGTSIRVTIPLKVSLDNAT
jgi:PAS domain S-box-containing protein